MKKFFESNFTIIVLVIAVFGLFKGCGDSRELAKVRKEITEIKENTYTKEELNVRLQIEGLRAEKRMIQSTDRKMMDVNRQTQIEEKITELESSLK